MNGNARPFCIISVTHDTSHLILCRYIAVAPAIGYGRSSRSTGNRLYPSGNTTARISHNHRNCFHHSMRITMRNGASKQPAGNTADARLGSNITYMIALLYRSSFTHFTADTTCRPQCGNLRFRTTLINLAVCPMKSPTDAARLTVIPCSIARSQTDSTRYPNILHDTRTGNITCLTGDNTRKFFIGSDLCICKSNIGTSSRQHTEKTLISR